MENTLEQNFAINIPVFAENDLVDSYGQQEEIKDKKTASQILNVVEKFVNKTIVYLNNTFEKPNHNVWQSETLFIKHIHVNLFIFIEHGNDYLYKEDYNVFDIKDYNEIVNKIIKNKYDK